MVSFTTVLTLATSALVASAQEQPPKQILPEGYPSTWAWHVSNWEAGCSRGGCSYNFNVTVPAVQGQTLGVEVYCNGRENGVFNYDNTYEPCKFLSGGGGASVAARFRRRDNGESPKKIEISVLVPGYAYEPQRHPYNFTAYGDTKYNAAVAPQFDFDVYPTVWQQLPIPEVPAGSQ